MTVNVPGVPMLRPANTVPPLVSLTVPTTVPVPSSEPPVTLAVPASVPPDSDIDGAAGDIDDPGQGAAAIDVGGAGRLRVDVPGAHLDDRRSRRY